MDATWRLAVEFSNLKRNRSPQGRGLSFERVMHALFHEAYLEPSFPFTAEHDQIDGSIHYDGQELLVELKWTKSPTERKEVDAFAQKLKRRGKPGLFLSISGFQTGISEGLYEPTKVLLMTGRELGAVFNRHLSLWELLDLKLSAWPSRPFSKIDPKSRRLKEARWPSIVRAIGAQTEAELAAVGGKYRPNLYVPRAATAALSSMLATADQSDRQLALVIDRAGSGKTNLLCHLAHEYIREHVVLFLRGGSLGSDRSLSSHLWSTYGEKVPARYRSEPTAFFRELDYLGTSHRANTILLIDAINESADPDRLKEDVLTLLAHSTSTNLRVVVTCRDIFWPFLEDERWGQYVQTTCHNQLYEFTEAEFEEPHGALSRYFLHFRITGQLIGRAREQCRHPLLLRFFCEAFAGEDVGTRSDIRLVELFDEYWDRKVVLLHRKRYRMTQSDAGPAAAYLFAIVASILRTKQVSLPKSSLPAVTGDPDTSSLGSTYLLLCDEDVIIEETKSADDTSTVSFVYEEFMEYVIARYIVEKTRGLSDDQLIDYLMPFTDELPRFVRGLGVFVFLALMFRNTRRVALWPLLICKNDRRWNDVILDALGRLSAEGLDESTNTQLTTLLSPETPDSLRCSTLQLAIRPPFLGLETLAAPIVACAQGEATVACEAVRTMLMWPHQFFHTEIDSLSAAENSAVPIAIAQAIAEGKCVWNQTHIESILRRLCQHESNDLKPHLAMALERTGGVVAFRLLTRLLTTADAKLKLAIADRCASLGRSNAEPAAAGILEALIGNPDIDVATHAVEGYAGFYSERSVRFLMTRVIREKTDERVRAACLSALSDYAKAYCITNGVTFDRKEDVVKGISRLCDALRRAMHDESAAADVLDDEAPYLIHLLAIVGGSVAERQLLFLLKRRRSVASLGPLLREVHRCLTKELAECLLHLAMHGAAELRSEAVRALAGVRNEDAIVSLLKCLTSTDSVVVGGALEGLLVTPDAAVRDALPVLIRDGFDSEVMREKLAFELRYLPSAIAIPALTLILKQEINPRVRQVASESRRAISDGRDAAQ